MVRVRVLYDSRVQLIFMTPSDRLRLNIESLRLGDLGLFLCSAYTPENEHDNGKTTMNEDVCPTKSCDFL